MAVYKIISPLLLNGKKYKPGDTIELPAKEAKKIPKYLEAAKDEKDKEAGK